MHQYLGQGARVKGAATMIPGGICKDVRVRGMAIGVGNLFDVCKNIGIGNGTALEFWREVICGGIPKSRIRDKRYDTKDSAQCTRASRVEWIIEEAEPNVASPDRLQSLGRRSVHRGLRVTHSRLVLICTAVYRYDPSGRVEQSKTSRQSRAELQSEQPRLVSGRNYRPRWTVCLP